MILLEHCKPWWGQAGPAKCIVLTVHFLPLPTWLTIWYAGRAIYTECWGNNSSVHSVNVTVLWHTGEIDDRYSKGFSSMNQAAACWNDTAWNWFYSCWRIQLESPVVNSISIAVAPLVAAMLQQQFLSKEIGFKWPKLKYWFSVPKMQARRVTLKTICKPNVRAFFEVVRDKRLKAWRWLPKCWFTLRKKCVEEELQLSKILFTWWKCVLQAYIIQKTNNFLSKHFVHDASSHFLCQPPVRVFQETNFVPH
jgi:hypothetical protein